MAFESKGITTNLMNTKVMTSGGNAKDGLSMGKVNPCGICGSMVNINVVVCGKYDKWVHCRNAGRFKCEENIGVALGQNEILCNVL